jgi:acetaldehyde dehydrogenase (acetylating)
VKPPRQSSDRATSPATSCPNGCGAKTYAALNDRPEPHLDGTAHARGLGLVTSAKEIDRLLAKEELPDLVSTPPATNARASAARRYHGTSVRAIDLTPVMAGPFALPAVNLHAHLDAFTSTL